MCCCCPTVISAIFCLWVQSGFSKGTVAGALLFFPPDPPLYKFERFDKDVLDPRLQPPRFHNGGTVEAVKIPTVAQSTSHCAAIVYKVPPTNLETTSQGKKTMTIIYSHGNATDIGAMYPLQAILSNSLECNVVSYDYSGYGESGGTAMESNTYTDIAGVYEWTLDNVCFGDQSRIILYGQSVGSGPCCRLSQKIEGLGGMILHSPFMSGMRVLTPSRALACLDVYPNIDRVRKTKCPVMVIHGRLDEEVDITHGTSMHQAVPHHFKRDPWWVPDRGHNDITEGPGKLMEYVGRLRSFMESLD
ncbi:alpha/beta-hydrolase [Fragilariopsis cylindrus CCMP1102]|uniref:Alpha/beta-hydrolase n=1 Tax=Fragilariopsis cylindrus CCMP1102 TaxID=635003 RepID=A0A1E7FIN2_9STRA|nr:alpha/beta-hydrolase [Fragilariopsis cylindrus CCMP1102]|eukprot:OEU18030.1 alpha/beta-hydrolase [Fragilariopsis cylindrus CCMP1102]